MDEPSNYTHRKCGQKLRVIDFALSDPGGLTEKYRCDKCNEEFWQSMEDELIRHDECLAHDPNCVWCK